MRRWSVQSLWQLTRHLAFNNAADVPALPIADECADRLCDVMAGERARDVHNRAAIAYLLVAFLAAKVRIVCVCVCVCVCWCMCVGVCFGVYVCV